MTTTVKSQGWILHYEEASPGQDDIITLTVKMFYDDVEQDKAGEIEGTLRIRIPGTANPAALTFTGDAGVFDVYHPPEQKKPKVWAGYSALTERELKKFIRELVSTIANADPYYCLVQFFNDNLVSEKTAAYAYAICVTLETDSSYKIRKL